MRGRYGEDDERGRKSEQLAQVSWERDPMHPMTEQSVLVGLSERDRGAPDCDFTVHE